MEKENMGFAPNNAKWYLTEIVEEITVADTVGNKVHRSDENLSEEQIAKLRPKEALNLFLPQ